MPVRRLPKRLAAPRRTPDDAHGQAGSPMTRRVYLVTLESNLPEHVEIVADEILGYRLNRLQQYHCTDCQAEFDWNINVELVRTEEEEVIA